MSMKFKTIKDSGRDRRTARISATKCRGAFKPEMAEKSTRHEYNRQDPARLTRVLAIFGD